MRVKYMERKFEIKENSMAGTCLMTIGGLMIGIGGISGLANKMTRITYKMYNAMANNPGIDYSEIMKVVDYADRAEVAVYGIAIAVGGALVGAALSSGDYTISEVSPEHINSPIDGGLEKISMFHNPGK